MKNKPNKSYGFEEELDNVDPSDWLPNDPNNDTTDKPNAKAVEEVAQKAGFTGREPEPVKEPDVQINIRTKQSVADKFRKLGAAQEPKWPINYTLERAVAALERELVVL